MNREELKNLEKKEKFELQNHAGKKIGRVRFIMQ